MFHLEKQPTGYFFFVSNLFCKVLISPLLRDSLTIKSYSYLLSYEKQTRDLLSEYLHVFFFF